MIDSFDNLAFNGKNFLQSGQLKTGFLQFFEVYLADEAY